MIDIKEYNEGEKVKVCILGENKQGIDPNTLVIRALNEGGYNCTEVDLLHLINWVKENMPELL